MRHILFCLLLFPGLLMAQFDNGYYHSLNEDHLTLTKKLDGAGYIQCSTMDGPSSKDIRLLKVDAVGNILADVNITNSAGDEYGLHVVRGNANTYIVSGYERVGSYDLGIVMKVDTSFNVLQKVYLNAPGNNKHTPALSVINSAFYDQPSFGNYWPGDPSGGYLVVGFEAVGYAANDSKSAYALKLDNNLNFQWMRKFDSTLSLGSNDWDMANSAGWIWTGAFGYFIGGSGTTPSGEQCGFAARLSLTGTVVWKQNYTDNNTPGNWSLAADCAYDDAEFELYHLTNHTSSQSAGIVAFNEFTGVINMGRTRYLASASNDYYGFEFAATCAGAEILISGYGLNKTSGSISGTFPFVIRYNKNVPMVDTWWQHYAYPVQSANYSPSSTIFSMYSTAEQPRIYYPKLFASRQVNYLALAGFEDNLALSEIHILEPYFDGKDSCNYIDPAIVAIPTPPLVLTTPSDVLATYTLTSGSHSALPESNTPMMCINCPVDPTFTFTVASNCCYNFTAAQANFCANWSIYDVSNNVVATGNGLTYSYCFPTNGTYVVEYCDCAPTNQGIICRECSQQTIVVNCPTPCANLDSDFSFTISGCTVNFTDLTPDGDPDGCESWVIGNLGTLYTVDAATFTFPGNGTYTVCHYDCCRPPGSATPIYHSTCYQITIQCITPCCLPTDFNVTGSGCCRQFNLVFPPGCNNFPVSYFWKFGDGQVSTQANPNHCYNGNGIYQVCVTVHCSKGNKITLCKNVKIKTCAVPPPPPCCSGTARIASLAYSGLSVTATGDVSGALASDITGVTWNWGDGSSSVGSVGQHYYLAGGTYTIELIVDLNQGGSSGQLTAFHEITVVPSQGCQCTPSVPDVFVSTPTVCNSSGEVSLHVQMWDEPAGLIYQWQRNNGTGIFVDMPGVVGQMAWVSGVVEGDQYRCRCIWAATGAVTYSEVLTLFNGYFEGVVSATPDHVCANAPSQLQVSASGLADVDWISPTSTSASISVSPITTTAYSVLIENSAGCGDMASKVVAVDPCVAPTNDGFGGAPIMPLTGVAYPSNNCFNGTLEFATVSIEGDPANVLPAGGQDVWYSFTASSTAVRITASSTAADLVIQLNQGNTVLSSVNQIMGTSGTEKLVMSNLIVGSTYHFAIRSYDGNTGPFSCCYQVFKASSCAGGTMELCSNLKPNWTGANQYIAHFTPIGGTQGAPTTVTSTSQFALSNNTAQLRYGGEYDVCIDAVYFITDGLGLPFVITVPCQNHCTIQVSPHADLRTKEAQRCPATITKGTWLQAKPFVCGAIQHQIEFQEVSDCTGAISVGVAFTSTTSGSSSSKWLQSVGGVQSGKWYKVRWRPLFAYGNGTYGTPDVIYVGGSASDTWDGEMANTIYEQEHAVIYPNPSHEETAWIAADFTVSSIQVFDTFGRLISDLKIQNMDENLISLTLHKQVESGLYLVRLNGEADSVVLRWFIEK